MAELRARSLVHVAEPQRARHPLIRIAFSNFPPGDDAPGSYYAWVLTHRYDVLVVDPSSDPPDILFYSTHPDTTYDHASADRTKTKKVFVTDDRGLPDLSSCDFAFSCHRVPDADASRCHHLPIGCVHIDWSVVTRSHYGAHYDEEAVCARLHRALFEPDAGVESQDLVPVSSPDRPKLTIGMATYDDYDGVYFTVQGIRLYHSEVTHDTEILVVDNNPEGVCAPALKDLGNWVRGYRCLSSQDIEGTAVRNLVFQEARGDWVLCVDSHVLLVPGALRALIDYVDAHPDTGDLLQGPLLMDDAKTLSTHFDPVWRAGMFGVWATDERGVDPTHDPFEIPMQGLGLFACRRDAWLGFSPRFRGFGGEEGYIHEKFRQAGRRTLCLPFLRWMHRFNRPFGTRYPINWEDRVRNYLIGHRETGVSTAALEEHFAEFLNPEVVQKVKEAVARESDNPFDFFDAIYCMNLDTEEDRWQLMRERFSKLGILHRVRRFGAVATPWNHHIGCALSHRAIVAQAQAQRLRNVLVFEDDAVFLDETLQHLGANLRELETIDWDVFHLGGHKWGNVYDKAAGCRHLERVSLMTCTQAVAYRDTIYDRILDDLPDDPGTMAEWIEHNAAIDQYLNGYERRFVTSPVLASQPFLVPQEDHRYRHRFVL